MVGQIDPKWFVLIRMRPDFLSALDPVITAHVAAEKQSGQDTSAAASGGDIAFTKGER